MKPEVLTGTWRPIIMSGPSVPAIISGQKTQTRRLLTPSTTESVVTKRLWAGFDFSSDQCFADPGPSPAGNAGPYLKVPFIHPHDEHDDGVRHRIYPRMQPGLRLWVRETWRSMLDGHSSDVGPLVSVQYKADLATRYGLKAPASHTPQDRWISSLLMPKWAARVWLEVTEVRIERLQEISDADILAEGCEAWAPRATTPTLRRAAWISGWDKLNAKRADWKSDPWVIATTFKLLDLTEDDVSANWAEYASQ